MSEAKKDEAKKPVKKEVKKETKIKIKNLMPNKFTVGVTYFEAGEVKLLSQKDFDSTRVQRALEIGVLEKA